VTAAPAVGIVADDLTGAADSAVQFAQDGWTSRLVLGTGGAPAGTAGCVTAIVTDSRALPAGDAHAVTSAAVRDLARAGAELVFVKIDSTMRGSVAAQVTGALDAWRAEHPDAFAVVTPAYPAMGRTVRGGTLLVGGARVETTAVGRDPVTPVATSELSALLPGSTDVAVAGADASGAVGRITGAVAPGVDVVTVDASTDDELRTTAEAVALLGARAVPVGSAGLAVAVSRAWGRGLSASTPAVVGRVRHVVVVVSSLHDASRTQYAHLSEASAAPGEAHRPALRTVAPTLGEIRAGDLDAALGRAPEPERPDAARVTVVLAPPRDGDPTDLTETPGGGDGATDAERIAEALAALTERLVGDLDDVALVLVGGEGARAVLRRAGAEALVVRGALREGVPWGTLEGGRLHGRPVVTKAGGFGTVATVTDVVTDLLDIHHRSVPQEGDPS
jgi:uncharacterized protein YgbK (DUF1537 family)